jgi:hypothetical protein
MRLEYLQLKKFHFPFGTRRIVMAIVDQEPFQKGRLNAAKASADFREALAKAMERSNVKYYRGEVAIEFLFASESPNAPHHHRLIKNYVDLIDEAVLRDDRQVRIIESCHISGPPVVAPRREPRIQVTVMPLHLYRQKHALIFFHDEDWDDESEYEHESFGDRTWNHLIDRAQSEKDKTAFRIAREREKEERLLMSLSRFDNPVVDEILNEHRLTIQDFPDPRVLVFPLPVKDPAQIINNYKRKTGIEEIRHQAGVDLNIEIVNFPDKDIDNVYTALVRELRRALLVSPIGDVRIYRSEADAVGSEARVKLLKRNAVLMYMRQIDEAVERALGALKESW